MTSKHGKPLIVLVHGAWHWGGCFQKVADVLAQRGYPTATPDLASHGYDATPYNAVRDMADYVRPVTAMLDAATEPVVLLGHSLGGASVSYLAEHQPRKIRRLIYLAAYMCPPGLAVRDCGQWPENAAGEAHLLIDPSGPKDGSLIMVSNRDHLRNAFYADCSERDIDIATANANRVNPLPPMLWPTEVTQQNFGSVPRTYIECSLDRSVPLAQQRRFQREVPGATVRRMETSHSPFFSRPGELADIIIELTAC